MNDSIAIKLDESQTNERASAYGNGNDTEECASSPSSIENYGTLLYSLRQKPSIILSTVLAFQVVIVVIFNLIWLPLVIAPSLCIHPDDPARIDIISLSVFSSGATTLLFSTVGIRLPVLFLPNVYYINSVLNILKTPELQCPGAGDLYAMGHESRTLEWQNRLKVLQGGFIVISLIQFIFGITGVSGLFDMILSNPLVLIPTTIMTGCSFFHQVLNLSGISDYSEEINIMNHWGAVVLTIGMLIIVGLKLQNLDFTVPSYTHDHGFSTTYLKLFRLFPVIFCGFFVLIIYPCILMLINGTKEKEKVLLQQSFENSENFFIHTPFSYGWPSFSLNTVITLLPAATVQITQSILIFRVTNFIYGENIKRKYINRGITMEAISNFIAGILGMGVASSPINLGLMQLTGVGSNWVVQLCGFMLILFSMSASSLQFLVGIQPVFILSALFIISALISVTGLSMMQRISTNSIRNCTVIGLALHSAFIIPNVLSNIFPTSNTTQILIEIFSSNIILCVLFASTLDAILPGKRKSDIHEGGLEPKKNKNKEKQGLSFCEELFAICF